MSPEITLAAVVSDVRERVSQTALSLLVGRLGLSDFERDTLLLCAAVEIDGRVSSLCEAGYPTFRTALENLPEAHWSALLPEAPLRRWRLVEVSAGPVLTASQLRIDETVLHFLMGVESLDERVRPLVEEIEAPEALPESYRAPLGEIARYWANGDRPLVRLEGGPARSREALAAAGCASVGLRLYGIRAGRIPANWSERETLARIWERFAAINSVALLIDSEGAGPVEREAAAWLAQQLQTAVLVSGGGLNATGRRTVRVAVHRPDAREQRAMWDRVLGDRAASLNGDMDRVAAQFPLDLASMRAAGARAVERAGDGDLLPMLWEECRAESRPALDGLAQRIDARAKWKDIVLPGPSMDLLRAIASHVRRQGQVLERWGFAAQSARGLGSTALFCGPSGVGKTMAAEVLANELGLDLYRIDLSQVVSKYIGETEKTLRSIFDAAEDTGALLLFDEADALFGKRTEVRDSHDRFANIEVSYLLQRIEAFRGRGLTLLTTNMRSALDGAFMRRIRYIVNFPFPDVALRRRIWETTFPEEMPRQGLNADKLARLNLPGGNIRNIALNAAFLAAEDGSPVTMSHLLVAARRECGKLEKPLTDAEVGGWV